MTDSLIRINKWAGYYTRDDGVVTAFIITDNYDGFQTMEIMETVHIPGWPKEVKNATETTPGDSPPGAL